MMDIEPEVYWEEWLLLVEEAKKSLKGTCPLLCDETILFINNYLKEANLPHAVVSEDESND
jgi:hypothetical protein